MKDVAKGALERFTEVLYGIAPGFVALAAIMLADSSKALGVHDLFGDDVSWRGVGDWRGMIGFWDFKFSGAPPAGELSGSAAEGFGA